MQLIETTSVILAALSIIAAIFGYLTSRALSEYRYHKWMLASVASVISILSISVSFYYLNKNSDLQKPQDLQSQLTRLDNVQKSMSDLNEYLNEQRNRLKETESTIQNLRKERDKLKPLVESDRKTVEALASMLEERKLKNIWKERIYSFLLGIISSLLAAVIFRLVNTKLRSKKPFITTGPAQPPDKPTLLFYDQFEKLEGWQDYKKGTISLSNDFVLKGNHSLKKHGYNDPSGGYKIFPKPFSVNFCFSGWVYRPSGKPGGKGDRLAVEDENFNGYGFCISHGGKWVQIELREGGKPSKIERVDNFNCPIDDWYQFLFYIKKSGVVELQIMNSKGSKLTSLSGQNAKYGSFDRIVIHGGQPYYVDAIKVEVIE